MEVGGGGFRRGCAEKRRGGERRWAADVMGVQGGGMANLAMPLTVVGLT